MKKIRIILLTALFAIISVSCSKDGDASLIGKWELSHVYSYNDENGKMEWMDASLLFGEYEFPALTFSSDCSGIASSEGERLDFIWEYDKSKKEILINFVSEESFVVMVVESLNSRELIVVYASGKMKFVKAD